jgi:hypothetical protein
MVAEAGSWTELERLVEAPRGQPSEAFTIDLAGGLEKAEAELDARRPASVQVMFSNYRVGMISAQALAEPVQGRHLRPFLRNGAGFETLVGMAWQSNAARG